MKKNINGIVGGISFLPIFVFMCKESKISEGEPCNLWEPTAILLPLNKSKPIINMDKSNLLPFSNLDPDMAQDVPKSPWMEFHLALMGKIIFSRATRQAVMKWEIFNLYRSRKDLLDQVIKNEHKDYVLIEKKNFHE